MEKPDGSVRRVGTFTLGVTLVAVGGLMLAAMFWPDLPWEWAIRCAPLILISLGVETLLAARSGSHIRYDGVGMVLCFVLTCGALALCMAGWVFLYLLENGTIYL